MPRTKTTGRIYKSKAVSMDPKLLKDAEQRARALKMSFSDYVRRCLIVDIYQGGKMVITPEAELPLPGTNREPKTRSHR